MAEERNAPRSAAKFQGKVILPGKPDIDCTIRDVSATGARLQFQVRSFLPRTFALHFDGTTRNVRVMWQAGLFAGVRFSEAQAHRVPQQKRSLWGALRGR
jgi:hypothetical protein